MTISHLQTHRESAAYLFRRRHSMLAAAETESAAVARLERHLRMHLHVLGRSPLEGGEPKKGADAFAALAAELSSPDAGRKGAGLELACRWLSEGGAKGEGAFEALALFPPPPGDDRLLDLYRRFASLRPVLFRLWREQGACDPAGLLAQAELARWEAPLQEAALWYAADHPAITGELFRPFWRPLLDGSSSGSSGVALAALRGALLRGEAEVAEGARRGMEQETSPDRQIPFARLGALTGDPAFLPVLRSFCSAHPREGVSLLPVHGTAGAAEMVLGYLPAEPEEGVKAWTRLTGQRFSAGNEGGQVVEVARRWWEHNRPGWKEGERRVYGRPVSVEVLASVARQKSGQGGRDLFDQLASLLGKPLGCTSDTWQERRRDVLAQVAVPRTEDEKVRGGRRSA